jgi:hypothetical protein
MVDRFNGQRSEYGGGDGMPQRTPDGASLDLPGIASSAGERARLMRTAGIHDFDPARTDLVGVALTARDLSNMSAAEREAYELDLAISIKRASERQTLSDKTNGYILEPDQYIGENGELNGVTIDQAGQNADPSSGGPYEGSRAPGDGA